MCRELRKDTELVYMLKYGHLRVVPLAVLTCHCRHHKAEGARRLRQGGGGGVVDPPCLIHTPSSPAGQPTLCPIFHLTFCDPLI